MEEEKAIRAIARRYFEGNLSGDEEKRLFAYIRRDRLHLLRFKQWEKEWMDAGSTDERTDREWNRLQRRMRTCEANAPMLLRSRSSFWKKAAAVAAIVTLTIGLQIGVWNVWSLSKKESYFLCEAPYGEKSRVILSDGTTVWLNAGSTLKYADSYNASNRKVILEGEGYFEVSRREEVPFIVHTKAYDVVVKGTKFNVSAYADDAYVSTTLLEGAVVLDYQGKKMTMSPGESIRFDLEKKVFIRAKTEASHSKAWAENRMEFDNISLKDLLARLSRQYNVHIHLLSEELGEKTYCISLRNRETIGEVMTALQQIIPLKIERKDKDIYIR